MHVGKHIDAIQFENMIPPLMPLPVGRMYKVLSDGTCTGLH